MGNELTALVTALRLEADNTSSITGYSRGVAASKRNIARRIEAMLAKMCPNAMGCDRETVEDTKGEKWDLCTRHFPGVYGKNTKADSNG